MGCVALCSMPHGKHILFPFLLAAMSFVLSFRTLSSCDLISTKWAINCSSQLSSQCLFKANLNLGLLAKETFVNLETDQDGQIDFEDLTKVCQWYSEDEREWLLNNLWDTAILTQISVVLMAFVCFMLLGVASSYRFNNRWVFFRMLSVTFGFSGIINALPLLLHYSSDVCTIEDGICDSFSFNCVSSCKWAGGSWLTASSSLLFACTAVTTWLVTPPAKKLRKIQHGHNGSSLTTERLEKNVDHQKSGQICHGNDESSLKTASFGNSVDSQYDPNVVNIDGESPQSCMSMSH